MTEVTPHPECPFSHKTFELLEKFEKSSSKDFYLTHEKEFKDYVEQPLYTIYKYVTAQIQGEIIKKVKININPPQKTTQHGCEYKFYYHSSNNIKDAHLFINITPTELRFGLFFSQHSNNKAIFIKNIQNNRIKEIILQNTCVSDNYVFHYSSNNEIKKINFLSDWLKLIARQNSKTKNIQISTHLKSNEVYLLAIDELVLKIKSTLESVYILFLVAVCDDPIREINEFLNPKVNVTRLYIRRGLSYYEQKKYEEAVKEYNLALEFNPNFVDAYKHRHQAKTALGDINGAISDLDNLLLIQTKNSDAYDIRGNLYCKLDYYDKAIHDYSQAILINANYSLAYYHRGCAYLEFSTKLKAVALEIYEFVAQSSGSLFSIFGIKVLPLIVVFQKWDTTQKVIEDLRIAVNLFEKEKYVDNYEEAKRLLNTVHPDYSEPHFSVIYQNICSKKLEISESILRRYHLALKTRKFVILSGISGTGKTWLTKAYAETIGAKYLLVPVAPNWNTNEDLLGYFNPLDGNNAYHHTAFSNFLEKANEEYEKAKANKHTPRPYHLVLDEMNLARVEYYFAKFLSAMEVRMREGEAEIELAPHKKVLLPPNFYFIGTVNVDETTHSFADKIYDRAQMIELEMNRDDLERYLRDVNYRDILMQIWDNIHEVAPFAFRTLEEIKTYVKEAAVLGVSEEEALDEQLLQKILPKIKGADDRVEKALKAFVKTAEENKFNLSLAKANKMLATFEQYGFTSYF